MAEWYNGPTRGASVCLFMSVVLHSGVDLISLEIFITENITDWLRIHIVRSPEYQTDSQSTTGCNQQKQLSPTTVRSISFRGGVVTRGDISDNTNPDLSDFSTGLSLTTTAPILAWHWYGGQCCVNPCARDFMLWHSLSRLLWIVNGIVHRYLSNVLFNNIHIDRWIIQDRDTTQEGGLS